MVATLDYNTVISKTSTDVEQSKRDISFYFGGGTFIVNVIHLFSFLFASKQEKITKAINYQLAISTWLLGDVVKNKELIVGKDWAAMIMRLNKLINSNIEIQSKVEGYINKIEVRNETLETYNTELQQTISNYYSCLRLFQKATIKTSNETSELALSAVRRTQNTLKTIYAN